MKMVLWEDAGMFNLLDLRGFEESVELVLFCCVTSF
jgi:hypothetical protein